MHWVVTTGRDVPEATERALEALGIHESELEFVVLDEPGTTLFGLRPTPARIRARVRPTKPRPKLDRRQRRKGRNNRKGRPDGRKGKNRKNDRTENRGAERGPSEAAKQIDAADGQSPTPATADGTAAPADRQPKRRRNRGGRDRAPSPAPNATPEAAPAPGPDAAVADTSEPPPATDRSPTSDDRNESMGAHMSDISIDEQEPTAKEFLEGLLDAFGADATVESTRVDDDTVEIDVTGEELGLLVGQRGSTLNAVNELVRTAVAQQHNGRLEGRLRVDVAGYRARRKEALIRFATQQAEKVRDSGTKVALEPMSPPDRKIVHDTVNEIDGVHTSSQGEDRRRHVVIHPDD